MATGMRGHKRTSALLSGFLMCHRLRERGVTEPFNSDWQSTGWGQRGGPEALLGSALF